MAESAPILSFRVQLRTQTQKDVLLYLRQSRSAVSRREVESLLKVQARDATRILTELVDLGAVVCVVRGRPGTFAEPAMYRAVPSAVVLDPPKKAPKPPPKPAKPPPADRCPTHRVRLVRVGTAPGGALSVQCPTCSHTATIAAESPEGRRILRGY